MFLKKNGEMSRHGVIFWLGTGTLDDNVTDFNHWLPNGGIGYRLQVQPRMNLRIDIGFGTDGRGFYFNFNEAY